jgi:hypothetical protein
MAVPAYCHSSEVLALSGQGLRVVPRELSQPQHLRGNDRGCTIACDGRHHFGGLLLASPLDGSPIAARGHIIVVSVNYHLGILGFLADKALGSPSGDYGLQDQYAALRTVKQNIGAFGGDPDNVTLEGSSAGGASVWCDAIASPAADGLSQRGISEPVRPFYSGKQGTSPGAQTRAHAASLQVAGPNDVQGVIAAYDRGIALP